MNIENSLQNIARSFWLANSNTISLENFNKIVEGKEIVDHWENSSSKKLLDKGLIFNRNIIDGEEKIFFTFDYFGGYIIATWLIDEYQMKLEKKKMPKEILAKSRNNS